MPIHVVRIVFVESGDGFLSGIVHCELAPREITRILGALLEARLDLHLTITNVNTYIQYSLSLLDAVHGGARLEPLCPVTLHS
eukprot:7530467-Pyramimonas_sp.AAC.1